MSSQSSISACSSAFCKGCFCGLTSRGIVVVLLSLFMALPNAKAYDFMKSIQGVICFFSYSDDSHVRLDSTAFSGSSSIYYDQWHGRFAVPSVVVNDGERLDVVAVGDSAFAGLNILESIYVPTSVSFIGNEAFLLSVLGVG